MKLLNLTILWSAAKLATAVPFMELSSADMFPQSSLDDIDEASSTLAAAGRQWKVGDPCEEAGSPGTCVKEDLWAFAKPSCSEDITLFGCGSYEKTNNWNQVVNSLRCCIKRRCQPPWDKYFCKNVYKSIIPDSFHPDPQLCGYVGGVLCYIGIGDAPSDETVALKNQADTVGDAYSIDGPGATEIGGGDINTNLNWLASDNGGLALDDSNGNGIQSMWETTPKAEEVFSDPFDTSSGDLLFSR